MCTLNGMSQLRRQQLFGMNQVLGQQFYGLGSIALGYGYNTNSAPVPAGGATTIDQGALQVSAADLGSGPMSSDASAVGEFDAGMDAGGML